MSLLAPLFLLGGLAVVLPIVFHLIRRSTREKVPFSSLMFLLPSPPRITKRSRLENLWLLALRCLVLGLLALGFARPFFRQASESPAGAATGHQIVLLIDTSASMRRADLWAQAKRRADFWLDQTSPADQLALATFDRQVRFQVRFDQWTSLPPGERVASARAQLQQTEPAWKETRLDLALLRALENLEELDLPAEAGSRQIILITDLQEGSRTEGLQGITWPPHLQIILDALPSTLPSNASLQILPPADLFSASNALSQLRLRLVNSPEANQDRFQLQWVTTQNQTLPATRQDLYLPSGQNRIVTVALPEATPTEQLSHLLITGDESNFDNRAFFARPPRQVDHLLFLGPDRSGDPQGLLFYLERAFTETAGNELVLNARSSDEPLAADDLNGTRLIVAAGAPGAAQWPALRDTLNNGQSLLYILRQAGDAQALASLLNQTTLPAQEAKPDQYAMFGQLDFTHPLLKPFADPRFSDFTKIHFWKYRRLSASDLPNARLVARFDNGDPALLEIPAGPGTIYVLTTGWHPSDSQLALSSKFVPLLYSLLEQCGGAQARTTQFTVGDSVPLPAPPGETSWEIKKPDGTSETVAPGQPYPNADQPGLYTVASSDSSFRFAVNLSPAESKTTPLPLANLEQLGLPLRMDSTLKPADSQNRSLPRHDAEVESRQKLWRWLLLAALTALLIETWLSGRLSRLRIPESVPATGGR